MSYTQTKNTTQKGNSIVITDSIRDTERPIQHTVHFTWIPTEQPCPFSIFKTSGPYKGTKRVEQIEGSLWRADYVSPEEILNAIDSGEEIFNVRTERSSIKTSSVFNICPAVMNEVKRNWFFEDNSYKCFGLYKDKDGILLYEAEFIMYPYKNKKNFVAEVRVMVLPDGFGLDMFTATKSIRDNFIYWVRYGNKGRDGEAVDRYVSSMFQSNPDLSFESHI